MLKKNICLQNTIKKSGMTQGKIAKKTGLSASRLSRIIHGYTNPRKEEEEAICRILGDENSLLFTNIYTF